MFLFLVTCVKYDDVNKSHLAHIKTKSKHTVGLLGVDNTTLRLIFSFLTLPRHPMRQVTHAQGKAFADSIDAEYYEVSAEVGYQTTVIEMFNDISKKMRTELTLQKEELRIQVEKMIEENRQQQMCMVS